MKDIYPIKGIENLEIGDFNIYVLVIFFILIFFILFYLSTKKYLEIKKYFKNKIILLEKDINNLTKTKFYEKLNQIFREYFSIRGIIYSDKMTLKEIEDFYNKLMFKFIINKDLLSIFKETYILEFSKKEDSINNRKDFLKKIYKLI